MQNKIVIKLDFTNIMENFEHKHLNRIQLADILEISCLAY